MILAVPPWAASELLPELVAPTEFRSIVNAHFKIAPPAGAPFITGVIHGAAEWIFTFADRVSIMVSGADAIVDEDREALARRFWTDVAKVLRIPGEMPPWQVVKERRATFAATGAGRPPPLCPNQLGHLIPPATDRHRPARHQRRGKTAPAIRGAMAQARASL